MTAARAEKDIVTAARQAMEMAHAPYSNFKVGAAVLGESGREYTGCNVENASYGLAVCAERVAIQKAISEGERYIRAIAIVAGEHGIARPCGACLQVMREFAMPGEPFEIVASSADGSYDVHTLDEYQPMPFAAEE